MTSKNDNEIDEVCASCGISAVDTIKLKKCNACKLARYCSTACQKKHRPEHKCLCKKRAAELRDELLFKQPESSHLGDCSLCCLPLPCESGKTTYHACCSKLVCDGCVYANIMREKEQSLVMRCPFCRTPFAKIAKDDSPYNARRMEANDPIAICHMGMKHRREKKFSSALELFTKAAELGDAESHFQLVGLYMNGEGVEPNEKKETHHLEEAAIGGHPIARYSLGLREKRKGRIERSTKHFIIAANMGFDSAIEALKESCTMGFVRNEDLAAANRAHKEAVDATKSPQREAAEPYSPAARKSNTKMK